jgi:indole-3-glycerol phosphate synthase
MTARRETGFLSTMAQASRERVRRARTLETEAALLARAHSMAPPPQLSLGAFDVIAEVKLRSPAAGVLAQQRFDIPAQVAAYAAAGAAAVSVLTEPLEFHGELAHLACAAALLAPAGIPAMRKDFLTEPYQVLEARAAGAGGVLVIVTMLDDNEVRALLECARECGLFVLLEAFDAQDLERVAVLGADADEIDVLVGVNCRDLRTLDVRFARFAELAPHLPSRWPVVAESGIATNADVQTVAALGYRLVLAGSALMQAPAPAALLSDWLRVGRDCSPPREARCS